MSDEVQVIAYLKCTSCGNDRLVVGLSTKKELMIGCEYCGVIVALIDCWPNQEMLDAAVCDCEECVAKKKENFN
jgi:predicted nucleic acid-binding Zn ribbon protein